MKNMKKLRSYRMRALVFNALANIDLGFGTFVVEAKTRGLLV